jgi:hypothetical protein
MLAVLRTIGLRPQWLRTDRTRRGWHVIIKLTRSLLPAETVAVQALLGSDSRRESLNLMRAISVQRRDPGAFWRRRWNLLFTYKLQDRKSTNSIGGKNGKSAKTGRKLRGFRGLSLARNLQKDQA